MKSEEGKVKSETDAWCLTPIIPLLYVHGTCHQNEGKMKEKEKNFVYFEPFSQNRFWVIIYI
jgi:hypothetical protein